MHYVFLAGAVATAIALGSVSAFALENHNLYPDSSPYSVLTPDSAFSPAPYQGGMREGRAAFVGDNRRRDALDRDAGAEHLLLARPLRRPFRACRTQGGKADRKTGEAPPRALLAVSSGSPAARDGPPRTGANPPRKIVSKRRAALESGNRRPT